MHFIDNNVQKREIKTHILKKYELHLAEARSHFYRTLHTHSCSILCIIRVYSNFVHISEYFD